MWYSDWQYMDGNATVVGRDVRRTEQRHELLGAEAGHDRPPLRSVAREHEVSAIWLDVLRLKGMDRHVPTAKHRLRHGQRLEGGMKVGTLPLLLTDVVPRARNGDSRIGDTVGGTPGTEATIVGSEEPPEVLFGKTYRVVSRFLERRLYKAPR